MTRRLEPGDLALWSPLDAAFLVNDSIFLRTGDGSVVPHGPTHAEETMLVLRRWSPDLTALDTWEGDVEVLLSTGRRGWIREHRLVPADQSLDLRPSSSSSDDVSTPSNAGSVSR